METDVHLGVNLWQNKKFKINQQKPLKVCMLKTFNKLKENWIRIKLLHDESQF